MEDLLRTLNETDEWRVEMGSSYDGEESLYAARVTLLTDSVSRGAVARDPIEALELAINAVLNYEDSDEDVEGAARVLKATLDELGFDRAVALLERLNNL